MKKMLAVFTLFSLTLWAAGFWEKKKFSDWSDKEVEKILKDSPWAHTVDIPMGGGGGGGRGGGGGGDDFGGGGGGGGGVPTMSLVVRWQTALPMRQAMARERFGAEATTSAEAAKLLAADTDSYVIAFGPLPMPMLRDGPGLKSSAMLSVKGKEPIHAADLKGERQGNMVVLYIFFPRAIPITVEGGDVEFAVKLNTTNIKRKFKLKDMMFDGKLEL